MASNDDPLDLADLFADEQITLDALDVRDVDGRPLSVQVAPNLVCPASCTVTVTGGGYTATATFEASPGHFRWAKVQVEADDVTAEHLRVYSWARLRRLAGLMLWVGTPERPGPPAGRYLAETAADGTVDRLKGMKPTAPALMEDVALVYMIGRVAGVGPTRLISERYGVAQATASRWLANARKAGYLPVEQGRAA